MQMLSHPTPGTPIETSVISNDFYDDFRQLVTDVTLLKERNKTLQNRVDQLESDRERSTQKIEQQIQLISKQKDQIRQLSEMISALTREVEREKKTNEEARMNVKQQLQNQINSAQISQQNQISSLSSQLSQISNELRQQLQRTNSSISSNTSNCVLPLCSLISITPSSYPSYVIDLPVYIVSPLFHPFTGYQLSSTEETLDVCPFADVLGWSCIVVG
ncbi:hypothetical protein BLNAU_20146 [Blattamonas nauphoetae]|uniref:Uncharacterized protein n=1 Tax=Blattamonas nauphoetae TaxID=2049346 RepID=A0ABQ9WZS9_9EUKA|nr:hypothetical protein BLNAU_20146 [Blattamonas nauphoetae]